ncbi:MAG: DNA-directed RNA polymerase subunit K [Sulfolobales archaeon]|nr:DNA-directed RNA polymerase subunit K [Sulfolobales archaeon]MDW8082254.1 DNA-directed RNA polymerase subunit K [Sulfolobales archaeon]
MESSGETSSRAGVRIWLPKLTKFERARVIGSRALQLAMGARPLIDVSKLPSRDFVYIARQELLRGVLPFTIVRRLPDGSKELIPVSHLIESERSVSGEISL